jgi:prepilin-type processing-associated H-X9-DG protein
MSPLAKFMQITFDTGATQQERLLRFDFLRTHPVFVCPSNQVMADPFRVVTRVDLMVSYNTASQFHLMPKGTGGGTGVTQGSAGMSSPPGYAPKLNKVGPLSGKIYIADGARYSNADTPPDIDLSVRGSGGGAFSDIGAFTSRTNGWDRSRAPGNSARGSVDARIYAFRHGRVNQNGPSDEYRLNAGFFDGHVETLGDLQASNPNYWMPTGSEYNPSGSFPLFPDAQNRYGADAARGIQ